MPRRFAIILACTFMTIVLVFYQPHELKFYENNPIDSRIGEIFEKQRANIRKGMENFIFPSGVPADLEDLVMERGGNPIRTIIVTSWRSGSTFLGDIIQSVPGTYYFFEPLLESGVRRFHKDDYSEKSKAALHHLKKLLTCDFTDMVGYLALAKQLKIVFSHNKFLWPHCHSNAFKYCQSEDFMSQFCKLFPFITMKTVRLGLDLAQRLLYEKHLNIRILLLVRDPRGTMHSRKLESFCKVGPECDSARRLCKDLMDDFKVGRELNKKFPHHFKAIRYEDLSTDLDNKTGEILKFLELPFHLKVKEFLETHTKYKQGSRFSTFRHTSATPFQWMLKMDLEHIRAVENVCAEALDAWGYRIASNSSEYQNKNVDTVLYKDYKPFR